MKNKLKYLFGGLVIGCVLLGSALVPKKANADTLVTNFPSAVANGKYALITNAARISSVQVLAGTSPVILFLYDTPYGNTNYTNQAYATRVGYSTNIVTATISPLTGYTNTVTNVGWFTASITNAANTNNPLPYKSFAVQANTLGTFPVDYTFTRGITAMVTTNASLILNYTTNQ